MLEENEDNLSDTCICSIKRYMWNVTMIKGRRSSSSSVIMEIVDNRAPLVVMETTDLTINSGEPLRLSSIITTYNKKPVKVFWDCAQVEGTSNSINKGYMLLYDSDEFSRLFKMMLLRKDILLHMTFYSQHILQDWK